MGLLKPMSDTNADRATRRRAEGAPSETPERDAFAVIEALNAENSQLKDRILRTLAEMENLRRRTEREVADAKTYGVTSFARDMLTVVDNLARALEHAAGRGARRGGAADPVGDRRRRTDGARSRGGARPPRRQETRSEGPEVRPELPSGDLRGAGRNRAGRHRLAGRPDRLDDRRPGACARRWSASPRAGPRPPRRNSRGGAPALIRRFAPG